MDVSTAIDLLILAFAAAVLNGAVGYGFSSVVTPIALFWVTNRLLNPALVLVELGVNVAVLFRERAYIAETWRRAFPVVVGLVPGVALGTLGLLWISATGVRLFVYLALLPLVVVQLLGFRRAIRGERTAGPAVGAGVGFLYSLTTISGPPLALFWRNQGLAKNDFRCTMAQVRVAEASMTTVAYLVAGLFTPASLGLVPLLLLPVVVGVPIGVLLLTSFSRDFFSRVVMAVDGGIVSYGIYRVSSQVGWLSNEAGFVLFLLLLLLITIIALVSIARLPVVWARDEPAPARPANGSTPLDSPGPETHPP